MTNGLFIILLLMLNIYSPINPKKNSCIPPKKNIPMMIGAIPAENLFHQIIFNIKYINAIKKLPIPIIAPKKVANLKPIFVYEVKLNIAAS